MLKSCPYVKSLGKLVEKGFSFFWGPSHAPTLVPPEVPFEVSCDSSLCHQADRVDHCVPVFKETISFTHGMPAVHSHDILEESLPAPCAEAPPVDDVFEGHVSPEPMIAMSDESALAHPFSEGPHGNELRESKDSNVRPSQPEILSEEPKALARQPKIPVDHLLTHQPAHPACDVCRQAKLRAHAHRRFKNQAEAQRIAQAIEAPKAFLQAIAIDHLESTEEGSNGELYALICVDLYSGALFAYPASSKSQTAVERALVHFARGEKPIVHTDRYPSLLAALKHLNFPIEPSIPNDVLHNSSAEAGIRIVRQGTRTLLLQSGLPISAWPRAMQTFAFQYDCTTAPNLERGGIRELSHQMVQELTSEGVGVVDSAAPAGTDEDAVGGNLLSWESKLHLALTYQPEIRMVPFGACVWYRDPTRPKSFKPNGIPAVYVGPEVLPPHPRPSL